MTLPTPGLLGRKLGMTQIFGDKDEIVPVTVIDVSGNSVVAVKSASGVDGYDAVQLGLGQRKASRTTKAVAGHAAKAGVATPQVLRELRIAPSFAAKYALGQVVSADTIFTVGTLVDVVGTSKGRGFAGVMKRHNFRGFIRTHGTHEYFRHGGSIGTRLTPGHVMKGKRMGGHMGAAQVTIQNLRVARVDAEKGLVFVKGAVPGPAGGLVLVKGSVKQAKRLAQGRKR